MSKNSYSRDMQEMDNNIVDALPNAPLAMPRQVLEPQSSLLGWFGSHLMHFWHRAES